MPDDLETQRAQRVERMRYVLGAALVFGLAMGAFLRWQRGSWYYAFHGGFFSAFAFGWLLFRFMKLSTTSTVAEIDAQAAGFPEGEAIVHHGPANHQKGIEAVGGKLFLTTQRLRFRSHKFNVQTHDESYPVGEIASVEPARSLGILPNRIVVELKDGRRERFVVFGRGPWIEAIRKQVRTAPATRGARATA